MMVCVYNQLAIDYNCSPDDFLKDGFIFTETRENEDRRSFPWVTPRMETVMMGHGVVTNASEDVLPYIRKQLEGRTRFEVFCLPFIYRINPYFLPNIDNITILKKPEEFEYEIVEKQDIHSLYEVNDFQYTLQYDVNSLRPEMVVVLAKYHDKVVGIRSNCDRLHCKKSMSIFLILRYRRILQTKEYLHYQICHTVVKL